MSANAQYSASAETTGLVTPAGQLSGQSFGTTDVLALFPTMSAAAAPPARPSAQRQAT
jgi:hypothetical protein